MNYSICLTIGLQFYSSSFIVVSSGKFNDKFSSLSLFMPACRASFSAFSSAAFSSASAPFAGSPYRLRQASSCGRIPAIQSRKPAECAAKRGGITARNSGCPSAAARAFRAARAADRLFRAGIETPAVLAVGERRFCRILLGGYIIFVGIRLLIQVTDQDPSNRILLSAFATVLTLAGAVSVIYSGRKLWSMLKPEEDVVEESGDRTADEAERKRAAEKRKGRPAMVDISVSGSFEEEKNEEKVKEVPQNKEEENRDKDADSQEKEDDGNAGRADDAAKSETAAADGIKEKKPDSGEKEEDDTEEARQEEETEILEEVETDYEEM